jgi:glucose/arabinose dehydrogenase
MKHLLLSILLLSAINGFNQNLISSKRIATGLSIPVDISFDPSNNMYVTEKRGTIKIIDSLGNKKTFLDISTIVNSGANERGLLGLAFHPDYIKNGTFFVNYTNSEGATIISRFKKEPNLTSVNINTEKLIIKIAQPYNNHNGGDLNFDKEGLLYIGMGDGGNSGDPQNYSQNPKELLGKMLRLDINTEDKPYLIPNDNPYKNNMDTLPEIWAVGLRNPWRFSFDKVNNDLWIADVGQNKSEEINQVVNKGKLNFGWKCYEGNLKFNFNGCDENRNYVKPVHTYTTNSAGDGCSVTGGFVYQGSTIPQFKGNYLFGDFCTGNIWMLNKGISGEYTRQKIYKIGPQELSTFGQDNDGEIYYAELGNGSIYKITNLTVSTSEIDIQDKVKVHPNPVKDIFNIEAEGFINVDVYNINGSNILFSSKEKEINISRLSSGAYILNIETKLGSVKKKIVKI